MRALFGLILTVLASPVCAQVSGSDYSDAQAVAAAQAGLSTFGNPNLAMPNGANIAHTIYQARGAVTISGTSEATCFNATGDGNQTVQPVAMFVGARFHIYCSGRGQTGLANISTVTAKVKFGSTVIVSGVTLALPASTSAIPFWSDVVCTILSTGSSGTMTCGGGIQYAPGLSSATPFTTDMTSTSAVTLNTTIAQKIDATATLSNTIGSPSLTVYDAYIIQEN